MGELVVVAGAVEVVAWDPAVREQVEEAYRRYARLRREGYEFVAPDGAAGRRLSRFEKRLPRILALPPTPPA